MPQHYTDPSRATETYVLPDLETFYAHAMPREAYDRVYVADHCDTCEGRGTDDNGETCEDCPREGWYYWYCFPGCMPESSAFGPFATEALALEDARKDNES